MFALVNLLNSYNIFRNYTSILFKAACKFSWFVYQINVFANVLLKNS